MLDTEDEVTWSVVMADATDVVIRVVAVFWTVVVAVVDAAVDEVVDVIWIVDVFDAEVDVVVVVFIGVVLVILVDTVGFVVMLGSVVVPMRVIVVVVIDVVDDIGTGDVITGVEVVVWQDGQGGQGGGVGQVRAGGWLVVGGAVGRGPQCPQERAQFRKHLLDAHLLGVLHSLWQKLSWHCSSWASI